ncbi:hypothetical protein [Parvularcula sp. LCG005]|uniref:hypothetical protein n=1 Tax=Parvularcula sp. LCG005 TaxID=3078805 RepID=UPI0029426A9A|nr:hypothetical protein [Parvularcula sp. LCG005]WOI54632.1 hypothetical protein RUI03_06435 [Parvularcula sp. LCG005]
MRISLVLVACLWPTISVAAETPEYLLAYKAYDQALQEGDKQAAILQSKRAFRLGQNVENIDKTTLFLLAQNYIDLTLWTPTQDTVDAIKLCLNLDEDGFNSGDYSRLELELMAAFTNSKLNPKQKFGPLQKAIEEAIAAGVDEKSLIIIIAKLQVVETMLARGDNDAAYDYITPLYNLFRSTENVDRSLMAQTAMLRAVSMLSDIEHSPYSNHPFSVSDAYVEKIKDGIIILTNALSLYDKPAPTPDEIDPMPLALTMWYSIARTYVGSFEIEAMQDREFEGLRNPADLPELYQFWPQECSDKVVWNREPPRIPSVALRKAYNGVAFISYGFDQQGRAKDVRLISELPQKKFGQYAIEAAEGWSINADQLPKDCLTYRAGTIVMSTISDW